MTSTILVVDDDDAVRLMLCRLLESQGYRTCPANNASAARAIIAQTHLDLAVVDIVMPGESGLSFATSFIDQGSELPIILVSGYSPDDPAAFAARHRTVTFVPKPFNPDELLATIADNLGRHARRR